jgi:hypothetical protein
MDKDLSSNSQKAGGLPESFSSEDRTSTDDLAIHALIDTASRTQP